MQTLKRSQTAEQVRKYYPFTVLGSFVIITGIYMAARGRTTDDVYQSLTGILAVLLPCTLTVLSRVQAVRFSNTECTWIIRDELSCSLIRPTTEGDVSLSIPRSTAWLFFRIHVRVSGMLSASDTILYHVLEERMAVRADPLTLFLNLPLAGVLRLRGNTEIRDLFGLTRAGFGRSFGQTVCVRPQLPGRPQITQPQVSSGQSETDRTRNPDETRYYMREYIAGDRVRDINWKASQRFRSLITRISPETRNKETTITIYLRHFGDSRFDSLLAAVHLTYLSGWLLSFVRTLLAADDSLRFRVITADGVIPVDDPPAADRLACTLAGISLRPEPPNLPVQTDDRLVVFFTTPFDTDTQKALARHPGVPVTIFSTGYFQSTGESELCLTEPLAVSFDSRLIPVNTRAVRLIEPEMQSGRTTGAVFLEEVLLSVQRETGAVERDTL